MARNSPPITIQEISGNQFESLEAAQQSARAHIAFDLANVLRGMIESGALEIEDGRIIPQGTNNDRVHLQTTRQPPRRL